MSFRMTSLATTTMNQLQQKLDTVSHNLANSQTTGYKERQTEFSNILSQQINNFTQDQAAPRLTPDGIRQGIGARLGAINSKLELGSIQQSGRELDNVLLNANHFFQVQGDYNGQQEVQYTRDGVFYLNPTGTGDNMMLVNQEGFPILGQNGAPIEFLATGVTSIQMDDDGALLVQYNNQTNWENVGTVAITEAILPNALETVGGNQFRVPNGVNQNNILAAVAPQGQLIENGAYEASNVSLQDQMTEMIQAQRSYQMNARTITMSDQMQGLVNQLR